MSQKFLDLAGLTDYDGKLKEWFKSGVVDITDDEIRALFAIPYPANNEIWYTSSDGNVVDVVVDFETDLSVSGMSIISNNYSNGIGVITFSDILTFIGDSAFKLRETLSSITLPESITSIGVGSFMGCSSLTSVVIPKNVTNIGVSAFRDCTLLNNIKFEGSMTEWEAVTKGVYFNKNVPATYVQCSDGQVSL
jgi:hypothetical protein